MNSAHHCGSTQVLAEELAAVQKRRPGEAGVEDRLVGLAFSGGGIRSATFGLGVLESLHTCGLIRKVDLLSTVSGGGYIGAWLSANCRRHADWLDPKRDWTPSIAHLRRYSKYLSPKVGFFSADTWSMATIWLRNTVLIQTTVVLAIACVLLLPHPLFELFEQWPLAGNARWLTILLFLAGAVGIAGNQMRLTSGGTVPVLNATSWRAGLVGATICLAAAWLYGSWRGLDPFHGGEVSYSAAAPVAALLVLAGFFLQPVAVFLVSLWPSDDPPQQINYTQPWVQAVVIVPLMAASYFVSAILWGESTGLPTGGALQDLDTYGAFLGSAWRYWPFPLSVVFASIGLLSFCAIRSRHDWRGLVAAFGAPFVAVPVLHALLCGVMLLLHGWAADAENGAAHAFVWAPPLVALAFVLTIVVLIGMMGRDSTDEVREWWSRLGAWLGIYATAWMVIAVSAVYGPGWVDSALSNHFWKSMTLGGGWVGTVAAGLFAGNSESTSGSTSGKSTLTKAKELVAAIAPFLFIAGLLIAVACGLHYAIQVNGGHEWTSLAPAPGDRLTLLVPSAWLIVFLGCLGALLLMAARVDVNEFSLNAFYRNRLVRAYLGATRFEPGVRKPQNFTGFDGADDLPLASLAGQDGAANGPLHIVNCALNLGGSSDLALHTRHGASFTLSALHCGTAYRSRQPSGEAKELGFVRTAAYGGPTGAPTLGQAIAVSGAAASPNMGYHTSPVVAFLLTLFNVRLGWWFPNALEDGPDLPSPRFSLRYLFAELFGGATEKSDFLMISDGGHFENLAAYELVRRKCRVIIVSDGECDRELTFGGLGTLIRMCEVDFGAKITIDVSALRVPANTSWSSRRWAVGRIEYLDGSPDGTLIYLKASMTGREDTSVLQYKFARPEFPHETTGDQFYGEDQFESYRHLGREIALEVFGPRKDDPDMTTLALNLLASEDKASPCGPESAHSVRRRTRLQLDCKETMPKPLPPSTPKALDPPPSAAFPYAFFADVAHHPLQPLDSAFNLRNAWWLMDAAFLAYSSEADTRAAYVTTRVPVTVRFFVGTLGTQCYVAEAPDWVVLAFRGTQVDDFMASVIDWTVNVRFAPVPDAQEHLVHAGFLNAGTQVWTDVQAHVLALQAERARPFWITGHSLGAALATIAASFAASEPRLMLKGLYTYGSPRVGDAAFGHGIGVPVFRFRNNSDIVTNVPLGLVFRHVGALQHIDSGGHLHEHVQPSEELILKAGAIHLPAGESRALSGLLRTSQPTIPLPGFLADHAPVNYAIRIWNCYEASLGTRS